ncbi:MAG: endonuclease III [Nanoarchaeota archaeon]|nr:endonuclease III [Nanoarchaeota archaeon]
MKNIDNINIIMNILEKHFNYTERTTLNRMRNNQKSDKNSFKILISCLLSLRAKDETTERISEELFKIADTPQEIAKISTKKLEKIIFSTGHYHKKARTLKHVSKELIKRFNSQVPDKKEDLLSIKGIGPKTANIVLNFAFNQLVIPVDVHVHIVANRLGWVNTKTAEKTEPALEKILPKKYWNEINSIFVLFGREICQTFSPKCSICPINQYCPRIGVVRNR